MLMKVLVLFAIVSYACALDKAVYKEWKQHVTKYNRKFASSHESRKSFENFATSYARVMEQNRKFESGLTTYRASLNHLSDMDMSQLINITGLIEPSILTPVFDGKRSTAGYARSPLGYKVAIEIYQSGVDSVPASVDHAEHAGFVRDQKSCGSCYAHAAMKAIEMNIKIKSGQQFDLAPQQMVDCSHVDKLGFGNMGCDGGMIYNTMDFAVNQTFQLNCLAVESDLPYKNQFVSSRNCDNFCSSHSKVPFKVVGYEINQAGDLMSIKNMLAKGPAFAQVYVDQEFMDYSSGVFTKPNSQSGRANHAVVAVGYGKEEGVEYIKILNSWGPEWGDNGYIKVNVNSIRILDVMAHPIIQTR